MAVLLRTSFYLKMFVILANTLGCFLKNNYTFTPFLLHFCCIFKILLYICYSQNNK